jgi:hypothetical protein
MFAVRHKENARQTIYLPDAFFYRAPWKICARQRLKRTAIIVFPVVLEQYLTTCHENYIWKREENYVGTLWSTHFYYNCFG